MYCNTKQRYVIAQSINQMDFISVCETHGFLRAGLDGAHVDGPVLTDNGRRDQTLDAEVQDLDWDKVVVGDVDQVLVGRKQAGYQVQPTHLWCQ